MTQDLAADVAAVARIPGIPSMLNVVCRTTGMGFSAVARVTDSHWIACAVQDEIGLGLVPGGELELHTTLCDEIRTSGQRVVIDHVAEHPVFREHHTPQRYGFQSYISVPVLLPDGTFFGTLCAIDRRPARVNDPTIIGMFELFAQLIGFHLDALVRIDSGDEALRSEREQALLREQFIAVLGHDLRTPLGSITAGAAALELAVTDPVARPMIGIIQRSARRMAAMIENVMDFARGRLGGGIDLTPQPVDLEPLLRQTVAEFHAIWPDREVREEIDLGTQVRCDPVRIAQLASNLLGNALVHGAGPTPVRFLADTRDCGLRITVCNAGPAIPPEAQARLFLPFARGGGSGSPNGLGLGLFIASEIAKAHGGTITVTSDEEETCFIFEMPA